MANQLATDDLKKLLQSIGNDVSEIKEMVSYHTALTVAEEAASKEAANAVAKAAANKTAKAAANAAAKAKVDANANAVGEFELRLIDGMFYAVDENHNVYEYDELNETAGKYLGKYNESTETIEQNNKGGRRRKRKTRKGKKRSYRKKTSRN